MAVINAFAQDAVDRAEPLTVAAAYAQCRDAALAESAIGAIGLEIESHLVDLDHVADPVPWERVEAIAAAVGRVAPSTAVTVESGGQIELSGPPDAGVGQFCAPCGHAPAQAGITGTSAAQAVGLLTGMPPWAWRHTAPDRLPAHSDPAPDRGRPAR
jgi:glutamate--cysteine ligase